MRKLSVSDNKRFLQYEDGKPFFYLGDTAWELFHRLSKADSEIYLRDRAAKKFTVIQAVVLAEVDGLTVSTPEGHLPLHHNDPTKPNEMYFQHVDYVVKKAEELGLRIGMLPTWGDKWHKAWGAGPEIFTPENAHHYGQFLGNRYKDSPIIWILGGDRTVENDMHRQILSNMAKGLHAGDGGNHLRTLHPCGGQTSAQYFHNAEWLDFNMWQSGHGRNTHNYEFIEADYALIPPKPTIDAEPGYEDHTASFNIENGYLDDYDCRKSAYWAVFAGACGHTYGCHPIWQFLEPGRAPFTWARRNWQEAMHLPGSGQMRHLRELIESRPYLSRISDQSIITSEVRTGVHHVQATRDSNGSWAFIYIPSGNPVEIDLSKLTGSKIAVHWFDPRTGNAFAAGHAAGGKKHDFKPPTFGVDWVIVLDDASKNYRRPGTSN